MGIDEQLKERDEAMLSLDKEKILEYCKKYDAPIPDDKIVFWSGVHYHILGINKATKEQRQNSKQWLTEHGFMSE